MTESDAKRGSSAWNLLSGEAGEMFHEFSHEELRRVLPENPVPATAQEWSAVREARRARLREAMGTWPQERCPLEPEIVGRDDRGDFVVERILLRSRPNLVMTTHLYIPKKAQKRQSFATSNRLWL